MRQVGNALVVESQDDFESRKVIWKEKDCIRISGYGVIYHRGNQTFPQFYKYEESWDPHSCGSFYPTSKEEAFVEMAKTLYVQQKACDDLRAFINSLSKEP